MDRSLGKMVVGNILATAAIRYPDAPAIIVRVRIGDLVSAR
jgi:hypothetical protein